MRFLLAFLLSLTFSIALAQDNGFPFGQITFKHFNQPTLARDSSAVALVLKEFGEAQVNDDNNLILKQHYIIKILKKSGVDEANISIPIIRSGDKREVLLSVQAASYNIKNDGIQQSLINSKEVFTENTSKYRDHKKFTIPNVQVGSIIEVFYTLESPFFVRNFRQWNFQSHLPKLESEYWATIPGNYNYNLSLKGYLKLKKNESVIVSECFNLGGGAKSDCARYKFSMVNIPAFIEEDYMTSSSNYISSVNFELLEIKHFNGVVDKVTNEWKDADEDR